MMATTGEITATRTSGVVRLINGVRRKSQAQQDSSPASSTQQEETFVAYLEEEVTGFTL